MQQLLLSSPTPYLVSLVSRSRTLSPRRKVSGPMTYSGLFSAPQVLGVKECGNCVKIAMDTRIDPVVDAAAGDFSLVTPCDTTGP